MEKLLHEDVGLPWIIQSGQEQKISFQKLGNETLIFHPLMTVFAKYVGQFRLLQQGANLEAGSLRRMHRYPWIAMDDLRRIPHSPGGRTALSVVAAGYTRNIRARAVDFH